MAKFMEPFTAQTYALMRIVTGVLFFCHGLPKIFGILAEAPKPIGSQLWVGGVIELVAGLLIAIGFQTRWSAFVASGMMAVAYFQFHWKFQFGAEFFPIVNRGEMAVVYCFVFLVIASYGAGIWSVDGLRQKS